MDGAAITLMVAGGGVGAGYASDPGTQLLQELQFLVGDGPIADAYAGGVPVAEADLAGAGFGRWAGFCRGAVGSGVRAVFSFPLRVGAARVGVLTLYRAEPGMLDDAVYGEALVAAEMITRLILGWQAHAPGRMLAVELHNDGVYQAVVHQASGMISVQLDVDVGEALSRLRARSFATSRPIAKLAADVVAGRVRFDD